MARWLGGRELLGHKEDIRLRHLAVVIGDNCIDRYVEPINKSFVGGNAVNVAVAMHRKGISVSYIGAVGTDPEGQWILSALKAEGIDVSSVQIIESSTAFTEIALQNGDRIILKEELGVIDKFTLSRDTIEFIGKQELVHNTILGRGEDYIPSFKAGGAAISFDYSETKGKNIFNSCFPYVDIAFVSMPEADMKSAEEYARHLAGKGLRLAVITINAKGSLAFDGNRMWRQIAIETNNLVDTLGAGDSFIGTFLADWIKGWPLNLILEDAAIMASKTCGHFGGWLPFYKGDKR